jgi:hypothetical protein
MKIKIGERKKIPPSKCDSIAQAALQLPLVLQPPLPVQVFMALQPLSLLLQPPCPLQVFLPWQSCLPASLVGAFVPGALVTLLSSDDFAQPLLIMQPATMPVIAAATRTVR